MSSSDKSSDIYNNPRFLNSPWLFNSDTDWSFLKKYGSVHTYKKNEIVLSMDEKSDSIYYIDNGRVRTSVLSEYGEEKIILIIDRGNIIDFVPAMDNMPNYLLCTAVTNCTLYKINKVTLFDLMQKDSSIYMKVISDLTKKLRIMITEIEDLTFMSSQARIAKYLYRLSVDHGVPYKGWIKINVKFTHQEMGIYAGTHRVTASNILESMIKSNIICKDDGYVIIKDLEALKKSIVDETDS